LFIIRPSGLASCRRRPLSSNVRRQKDHGLVRPQNCACRRELNSHEKSVRRFSALPHSAEMDLAHSS
jgi:hypothetical protein